MSFLILPLNCTQTKRRNGTVEQKAPIKHEMSLRQFVKHLARKNSPSLRTYARTLSCSLSPPQNHHESRPPEATATTSQYQDNDPYALMKEDPVDICSSMWVKAFSSSRTTGPAPNLKGFLAKFDLWVLAYQRTVAYVTGAFPRRTAIDSQVLNDLLSLRNAVVHGRFSWNDKIDQLIRSPNDKSSSKPLSNTKLRALIASDEPCFQDRVVQEVLLMILEPVFEARFSPKSHGFRPNRNAHTVIRTIRSNFAGYLWFLRGDLTEIFESLDTDVAMNCLEKTIKDRKITKLVKSALKSPLRGRFRVERDPEPPSPSKKKRGSTKKRILNYDDPKPDPFWLRTFFGFSPEEASKVPLYGCLGILSPLLANVCLDELDKFVEQKAAEFYRPGPTPDNKSHNPSWPEFVPCGPGNEDKTRPRKMDYLRFGAHFLIGVRGARRDAVDLRKKIAEFCLARLGARLDNSRVEIEHVARGVEFLDHVISRRVVRPTLRYTSSGGGVVSEKGVGTLLSVTASLERCIGHFREMRFLEGERDPDPLPCTAMMYSGQAHTNAQMNRFLETMADWFRYADNRKKVVGFCAYVVRSSLAKLYAARYFVFLSWLDSHFVSGLQ